jgi:osomolarity two-component system response regulator SSK1
MSGNDGDGGEQLVAQERGSLDMSSSSKFGIAWPIDTLTSIAADPALQLVPTMENSSADAADVTQSGISHGQHMGESAGISDFQPTLESTPEEPLTPPPPRFSRALSMPLPSQLGHLRHPGRDIHSNSSSGVAGSPQPHQGQFQELSLELADSVQMMIQTLLQISPPQVLDPAKEQFSACSLSIPTPCMSAVFTSLKNLNYLSAHLPQFCAVPSDDTAPKSPADHGHMDQDDFDIGEMLQSVGDSLAGAAAQAGVDIVLFHGDVGMKHVAVRGDECGLSYLLSHVHFSSIHV